MCLLAICQVPNESKYIGVLLHQAHSCEIFYFETKEKLSKLSCDILKYINILKVHHGLITRFVMECISKSMLSNRVKKGNLAESSHCSAMRLVIYNSCIVIHNMLKTIGTWIVGKLLFTKLKPC